MIICDTTIYKYPTRRYSQWVIASLAILIYFFIFFLLLLLIWTLGQILWMWPDSLNVAGPESFWKAIDNDTGTCFLCIYWILQIQSVWTLTFLDLEGGGRNLNFPLGRKPWLLLGMEREEEKEWGEWEGGGRRGGNGNFYNLIKLLKKKSFLFRSALNFFYWIIIWSSCKNIVRSCTISAS